MATLLCSLVAGFLFAFAVVVMPGIKTLGDREFLRAFQAIDRVIQNNHPLFMLVWIGSVMALIAAAVLGFDRLDRTGRLLIIGATMIHILGVQLPTVVVNIPLNNRLQALNIDAAHEDELRQARGAFEPRWNRWNVIRTVLSCSASLILIILAVGL